jgi:hypothetical protein
LPCIPRALASAGGRDARPDIATKQSARAASAEWVRKVLVSLRITYPLATKTLLQSLIERKDLVLQLYIDILQRPTRLCDSTADVDDWLLYFSGSDATAESADSAGLYATESSGRVALGRKGYRHADGTD